MTLRPAIDSGARVAARETSPPDATDAAIIAAAREEFVRYGIKRANVEQIARRARVSRVTVYRRFSNKTELMRAVILAEIADFADRFDKLWHAAETPQEKIVETVVLSVWEIRHHPLLLTVMRSEPEQLLLQLTIEGEDTLAIFRTLLASRVQELVDQGKLPPVDAARASEVMLRLGYSLTFLPYGLVPGESQDEVRAFAREFILPIFERG
jgi:AcrR family transcriptional regulator